MSDDEIDKLFKAAAEEFKVPHDPSAWQDMASKLDQHTTPSGFWNWKNITVAAFVGLTGIALLWYIGDGEMNISSGEEISPLAQSINQKDGDKNASHGDTSSEVAAEGLVDRKNEGAAANLNESTQDEEETGSNTQAPHRSTNEVADRGATGTGGTKKQIQEGQREGGTEDQVKELTSVPVFHQDEHVGVISEKLSSPQQAVGTSVPATNKSEATIQVSNELTSTETATPVTPQSTLVNSDLSNDRTTEQQRNSGIVTDSLLVKTQQKEVGLVEEKIDEEKITKDSDDKKKNKLISLRLAVSPDFSSINFFTPDKPGFNYGLLVGYSFNNRWSVYSGVISSRKIYSSQDIDEPYSAGGYDYPVNQLDGDCRVLDIPVNIYYSFFPDRSLSIKAGLGISSYFMLSEDYTYHVDNPYGYDTYAQNIRGKNNEWFKMLNVSVVLQKRISNRFTFEVEPFVKAPLAGVGEGEVSLVSLGAFLNVRFDIPIVKND